MHKFKIHVLFFYMVVHICPSNAQCTASFNSTSTTICSGNTINFNNTSSGATAYQWKMNEVPVGTSPNISLVFPTAGMQQVELVITGPGSCSDSTSVVITVNQTPTVNVSVTPTTVYMNDSVYVNFSSSNVTPGATYAWNFCDAGALNNDTPFYYSWDTDGTYCVCVQLENDNGCQDNDCENGITVLYFDEVPEPNSPEVSVYPNPAHGYLVIDWMNTNTAGGLFFLTDLSGRVVQTHQLLTKDQMIIPLDNPAPGFYFVHLELEQVKYLVPLIIE